MTNTPPTLDTTVPANIDAKVKAMSEAELLARRQELQALGRASPDALSDENLSELCAIYARLRFRSSGPPPASKTRKRARVYDDLSDINTLL